MSTLDRHNYFSACLWQLFCHHSDSSTSSNSTPEWSEWKTYVLSITALFNFRQDNHPTRASNFLQCFDLNAQAVSNLVEALFRLDILALTLAEKCMRLSFLTHLFRSLDYESVRRALLPLLSLPVWLHLSDNERIEQLERFPYLRKPLSKLQRRAKQRDPATPVPLPQHAVHSLVTELETEVSRFYMHPQDESLAVICELVSLFTELLSQLRLRRTLLPLLSDRRTLYLAQGVTFELSTDARIRALKWWPSWLHIVDLFAFYFTFPLHPLTGETLSRDTVRADRARRLLNFQRICHAVCQRESLPRQHQLRIISLSTHNVVGTAQFVRKALEQCSEKIVTQLQDSLHMKTLSQALENVAVTAFRDEWATGRKKLIQTAMASYFHTRGDALENFRNSPKMITEQDLWGPSGGNQKRPVAALPTINLEFLNLHDYLLRNFTLYKWESAWAIREDIEDAVWRLRPSLFAEEVKFDGWAKMAAPLLSVTLGEVGDVLLDCNAPAHVKVQIELDMTHVPINLRREWGALQQHDVLFLLKLAKAKSTGREHVHPNDRQELQQLLSHCVVRGFVVDAPGSTSPDNEAIAKERAVTGSKLELSGLVDNFQYHQDAKGGIDSYRDFLKGFKVVVRRRAEVNNFFPILSSLRDLVLSERQILPSWMEAILLGRSSERLEKEGAEKDAAELDFVDTFVSESQIISSFPELKVTLLRNEFDDGLEQKRNKKCYKIMFRSKDDNRTALAIPYERRLGTLNTFCVNRGKARVDNTIAFSEAQIRAIHSGLKPGLTLVSGPPGTGKTSVIVQLVFALYHTKPHERILVITRTNHALNDLVARLLQRDVDSLRVLRLGQGESEISWDEPMSKEGRINALLQRRIHLLSEVAHLSNSLDRAPSTAAEWSCEAANSFFKDIIEKEWESFKKTDPNSWQMFPFRRFMEERKGILHDKNERSIFWVNDPAQCYLWISRVFGELRELGFLEVLRSNRLRGGYLMTTHARIIAMTCIHAAMQREELVTQGFAYDSVIMEEAAECLEVETFLSFVLQPTARLKRVVLVGDRKQLPPVVRDPVLQQKSNFGQSMFTRLVRAGHNTIQLCHQGRSRSSIANLYRWRYKNLSDMSFIYEDTSFARANPGFLHTAQFIDTGDDDSEAQPLAHYYQNLAEAEYIAFTFLYMRILGYPCERIAVLATYNGQVQLLREVISVRTSQYGNIGMPFAISTVDKFQGQQADFVLLSLVRTKTIGHFRDVRRITVAVSRARYGLYIFGYMSLFSSSPDFKPVLNALSDCRNLTLVAGETFGEKTRKESDTLSLSGSQIRQVHSPADMAAIVSYLFGAS